MQRPDRKIRRDIRPSHLVTENMAMVMAGAHVFNVTGQFITQQTKRGSNTVAAFIIILFKTTDIDMCGGAVAFWIVSCVL